MRHVVLSSLVLAALSALTGCSTSHRQATTPMGPSSHLVASIAESTDTTSDPSWTPPGEMSFSMEDAKTSRANNAYNAMPAPNRREIARGQIHAAY